MGGLKSQVRELQVAPLLRWYWVPRVQGKKSEVQTRGREQRGRDGEHATFYTASSHRKGSLCQGSPALSVSLGTSRK